MGASLDQWSHSFLHSMMMKSSIYYCNQSVQILKYINFVNYEAHYDLEEGYTKLLNSVFI